MKISRVLGFLALVTLTMAAGVAPALGDGLMPGDLTTTGIQPADINVSLEILSSAQKEKIAKIGSLSLAEQIQAISREADLELLSTGRKGGTHSFDSLAPAKHALDEIPDVEGLYGKAACTKGEGKPVIYLADDAPPSTLLHEYIHLMQSKTVKRWCELDGRLLEGAEKKERALLFHRFEFEALKTLWDLRDPAFLNFEDRIILVEGLNRENEVFKSIGVKALNDDEAKEVEKQLEEAHAQIHYLTWLTHSRDEAGSVLQKMEVLSLKSCVEQEKGSSEVKKINDCIQKRCSFSKITCHKITGRELDQIADDLTSRLIYSWLKPFGKKDCDLGQFKDELQANVEMPTGCWKNWYAEHAKKGKSLGLKSLKAAALTKKTGAPRLPIDSQIAFFEPENPEAFINAAYCYFIYQKVARLDTLPVDQFPYATLGAAIALKHKKEYAHWLEKDPQGKMCSKLVKVFTGEKPSYLEPLIRGKKNYALIVNPVAALTGGVGGLKKANGADLNHERLHIIFAEDKAVRNQIRNEWKGLSQTEQDAFKQKHPSYDFSDEDVTLREYFSYTRQAHPKKLF